MNQLRILYPDKDFSEVMTKYRQGLPDLEIMILKKQIEDLKNSIRAYKGHRTRRDRK